MSDTDSFIDEVTEEVRRDRLFAQFRKYAWIGVVLVLAIVGGTAWREYDQSSKAAAAQAFGDSILAALEASEPQARIDSLSAISAPDAGGKAVLDMLIAAEQVTEGQTEAGVATLRGVAGNTEVPQIYRQIANYKALSRDTGGLSAEERRFELEALATAAGPLRLLAQEQLALLEIDAGKPEAALEQFQAILADAEVTAGLRRRVSQMIVALGGSVE